MKKCIILDLDDTLWEGTIGELGRTGIKPNVDFQRKLLALKKRGVILAVCSKNDLDTGLAGFGHADMLLHKEDFAWMQINWEDKAENIQRIALGLNLGLDALVFVDDSAYERHNVRITLPEVAVPEYIEDIGFFFSEGTVTEEDKKRTEYYRADEKRRRVSPEELKMELTWRPFNEEGLVRVHQLVNKTNQFNLTTKRYTLEELKKAHGYQFFLSDIFGDSGMIGVIITREEGRTLLIDSWLMSCRVIGRGVEKMMFEILCEQARIARHTWLIGEYRPTSRNGIVAKHYVKLGFESLGDNQWGFTL